MAPVKADLRGEAQLLSARPPSAAGNLISLFPQNLPVNTIECQLNSTHIPYKGSNLNFQHSGAKELAQWLRSLFTLAKNPD